MDHRDLATELLKTARAAGADAADVLVAEGTEFSVTVRRGEVETLTEAGSKALGVRVFVGKRTASTYTSDFSWPTLRRLIGETVGMARVTGEDPAAGLPDEMVPPEDVDLALFDPSPAALPTDEAPSAAAAEMTVTSAAVAPPLDQAAIEAQAEALRAAVLQRVAQRLPQQVTATVRDLLLPAIDQAMAKLGEEAEVALRITLQELVEQALREELEQQATRPRS